MIPLFGSLLLGNELFQWALLKIGRKNLNGIWYGVGMATYTAT